MLRVEGILEYAPGLAAAVDAGREVPAASAMESEIRACAVHACELLARRLAVPPRTLGNGLWNRGQQPRYRKLQPHLNRTVYY